ncbi:MAG: GHKL domain-containing protein [Ruminococcus sp.]|nr:GHKL domain-containing protein [Ruminococcus sp.]
MMMEFLANAGTSIATVLSGIWVLFQILERRSHFFLRLLGVLGIAIVQGSLGLLQIPVLNMTSAMLMIVGSTLLCYRCKKLYFLVYDVLIAFCGFLTDVLAVLVLSTYYDSSISSTLQETSLLVRNAFTSLMTFLLCQLLFTLIRKKHAIFSWYEAIFYTMLATGEIAVFAYVCKYIQAYSSGMFLILFLIGCLVLDVYIVVVFYRISIVRKTEKENALLQQQSEMQLEVYSDLQQRYQNSMETIHDAKRHVRALESLIQSDHLAEAQQYKESLFQKLNELQPSIQCDNPLLSAILNHVFLKAEQRHITLKMDLQGEEQLSMLAGVDLTTIASNLLDNAVDAVSELPEEQRYIHFAVAFQMGEIMIHVENPTKNDLKREGNTVVSTKEGHLGLGLKNVGMVVKKYKGDFKTYVKDGNFVVAITIPTAAIF